MNRLHSRSSTPRCSAPDVTSQPAAESLGQVLAKQVASVAVVTACQLGTPVGLLVTSLAAISNDPPQLMFSISATSAAWPALEQADYLGIHLLTADQEELAERFAGGQAEGFAGGPAARLDNSRQVEQVEQVERADRTFGVAERLASNRGEGDAAPLVWRSGPWGVPILDGCAAWMVGRPQQRIHAGNHVIIVATLAQGEARADARPLVRSGGSYR